MTAAGRNARSLIPRLVAAWYPKAFPDKPPARQPGELSYLVNPGGWSAHHRGRDVMLTYEGGLTALLYVHRVVINSPLLMLSSANMREKSFEWQKDLFLTSLHLLSSLKELIDADIVVIIGSSANYSSHIVSDLADRPQYSTLDQDLRWAVNLALNSGCAIDIFAQSDDDYLHLQRLFGQGSGPGLASRSDAVHFATFLDEIVPDALDIDLCELIKIREDDAFENWRAQLRTAIRQLIMVDSTPGLEGEGIEDVHLLMSEKAAKLKETISATNSMTKLRSRIASFAVGGIGAAAAVPIVGQTTAAAEVTMLAGSLSAGALSLALAAATRSNRSQKVSNQALADHYSYLAKCVRR
jgi:hypothetical protein